LEKAPARIFSGRSKVSKVAGFPSLWLAALALAIKAIPAAVRNQWIDNEEA
jgi:hypothetical protein